ncbi:MAG: DUF72 domain-containing protein, partial [Proteobacteria bacterium]
SGPEEGELADLRSFLRAIPRDFPYAVEIRNPALVRPDFYQLLNEERVSPAFSLWTRMPSITAQLEAYQAAGPAPADLPLVGLGFLKAGRTYEEAVRIFQPYREVGEELPEGRRELAELGQLALATGRKAFLLVNNRLEGSAPHTVGALASALGR